MTLSLTSLEDRLRKARGADREIDYAIHEETNSAFPWGWRYENTPPYTASIDAAIALVERCLVKSTWDVAKDEEPSLYKCYIWPDGEEGLALPGPTAPIAILRTLVAILKAKEACPEAPGFVIIDDSGSMSPHQWKTLLPVKR